jgi:hypothetical protein
VKDEDFKTALDLYKNRKGRPKGSTKSNIVLLDYRTWIIEYDGSGFPAVTFNLRKKGSKHTAYCSTLESALQIMYNKMLSDYVNRQNDYGAKFSELAEAIKAAKNEIIDILGANSLEKFLKNDRAKNRGR